MKRILAISAIVGLVVTGAAYAAEPLTDQKMDKVSAGLISPGGIAQSFTSALTPLTSSSGMTSVGTLMQSSSSALTPLTSSSGMTSVGTLMQSSSSALTPLTSSSGISGGLF